MILQQLDVAAIEAAAHLLAEIKAAAGRIFFLGEGGSAANCSHAVNAFRKLAGIECYAPSDNVAELTTHIGDEGRHSGYADWLRVSRLSSRDAVFVLSVDGGSVQNNADRNMIETVAHARPGAQRSSASSAATADIPRRLPTRS